MVILEGSFRWLCPITLVAVRSALLVGLHALDIIAEGGIILIEILYRESINYNLVCVAVCCGEIDGQLKMILSMFFARRK